MNTILRRIQDAGPRSNSAADYDDWYNQIVQVANGAIPIKGEMDDEDQAETVGNFNPVTRQWESSKHSKIFDVTEEI